VSQGLAKIFVVLLQIEYIAGNIEQTAKPEGAVFTF
jgi:hypothetical protein